METTKTDILTDTFLQLQGKRRRALLPWWIKVFIWIFMIFGAIAPLALIFGILGYSFEMSVYGFETREPMSLIGVSTILIFLFKGFTAYSLWQEKDWAIMLGIIDGIIGILLCFSTMIYPLILSSSGVTFTFSLELILLIPYLVKMIHIKSEWERSVTI